MELNLQMERAHCADKMSITFIAIFFYEHVVYFKHNHILRSILPHLSSMGAKFDIGELIQEVLGGRSGFAARRDFSAERLTYSRMLGKLANRSVAS